MSLPVTADPLPSSYTFGKVVGRVIHLIADTAEDTDDKPQARAAAGKVTFVPKEVVRRTSDGDDISAIVLRSGESATLSSTGRVLDAEGRQGIWLAVGVYSVTFEITGAARAIPSFDIQVTSAHTDAAPLDLAREVPYTPPTGTVVQTIVVPSGGTEGQVLVRNATGGLVWTNQTGGSSSVSDATTTTRGIVELATPDETTTGTDTARAVTPAGLKAVVDALPAGGGGAVDSVNGQTGAVVLDAADVGAIPAGDAVELAVTASQPLTAEPTSSGMAADAGHTHRLPNVDGSGYITLSTVDGTPVKLLVVNGIVGAGGGAGTPAAAPAKVTGLAAGTPTEDSVPLSWTAPAPGDGTISDYIVQYRLAGDASWATFTDGTGNTASTTVTDLVAATNYEFRVAAMSEHGTGEWSDAVPATTATAAEEPPPAGTAFVDDFERADGPVANGWTIEPSSANMRIESGSVWWRDGGYGAMLRDLDASAGTYRLLSNGQYIGFRLALDPVSGRGIVWDGERLRLADTNAEIGSAVATASPNDIRIVVGSNGWCELYLSGTLTSSGQIPAGYVLGTEVRLSLADGLTRVDSFSFTPEP